jgi:uncharacterized protein
VQTNGILLRDPAIRRVLGKHNIAVSVSLDGDRSANRRRVNLAGRESYDDVVKGVRLLKADFPHLFRGFLCVINPDSDPRDVLLDLLSFDPPSIDFLLPVQGWPNSPPEPAVDQTTRYADWLLGVLDHYPEDRERVRMRIFENLTALLMYREAGLLKASGINPEQGDKVGYDFFGQKPPYVPTVVITPDGKWSQLDALMMVLDGVTDTGMTLESHALVDAVEAIFRIGVKQGMYTLAEKCMSCEVLDICRGGHPAQRFSEARGFDNPSVLCADLYKLVLRTQRLAYRSLLALRIDRFHELLQARLAQLRAGQTPS